MSLYSISNFKVMGMLFSIIPLLFIILIVLRIITIFKTNNKNDDNQVNYTVIEETTHSSRTKYTNKQRKPRLFNIIYTIVFTIIWFIVLASMIASFKQTNSPNFFYVFIIPFILAGILVLTKVIIDIKRYIKDKDDSSSNSQ